MLSVPNTFLILISLLQLCIHQRENDKVLSWGYLECASNPTSEILNTINEKWNQIPIEIQELIVSKDNILLSSYLSNYTSNEMQCGPDIPNIYKCRDKNDNLALWRKKTIDFLNQFGDYELIKDAKKAIYKLNNACYACHEQQHPVSYNKPIRIYARKYWFQK